MRYSATTVPSIAAPPPWVRPLLAWFRRHQRAMPWREHPTPYRVWLSEIMLQQTRVETVIPYFQRFVARFPTVEDLADAPLQDVLKLWEGLGYYSRARNLQQTARALCATHAGDLPRTAAALQLLPGIGPYTGAAIASIAFGERVPVVDGNVRRVFCRFWGIAEDPRRPAVHRLLVSRLQAAMPVTRSGSGSTAGDFNQALMELGALVCLPATPQCEDCPLRRDCIARHDGRTQELPMRPPPRHVPHLRIAVAVLWRRGRVLIQRRPVTSMLGGLWEFPGGKIEPGETAANAAMREVREETGLDVQPGRAYGTVRHAYSHFTVTLRVFRCLAPEGTARPHKADAVRWVRPSELEQFPFPKANQQIVAWILADAGPVCTTAARK